MSPTMAPSTQHSRKVPRFPPRGTGGGDSVRLPAPGSRIQDSGFGIRIPSGKLRLRDLRVFVQRLQELDEVRALGRAEVGLLEVGLVEEGIVGAAADHELHRLLE